MLPGLDIEWGRNTFWAPEIIWHDGLCHMYVTYVHGVPEDGRARLVYTSPTFFVGSSSSMLGISEET